MYISMFFPRATVQPYVLDQQTESVIGSEKEFLSLCCFEVPNLITRKVFTISSEKEGSRVKVSLQVGGWRRQV